MTTTFQDSVIPDLTPAQILDRLAGLEVEVWAEGERLRYRAPKGQLSADLKELLARRKNELLSFLRERDCETAISSVPRIVPDPAARHEPFPLTDLQQAYWVGRTGAFELGNVAPHFYLEADLPGLDLERFNQALIALIQRHDMLRAVVGADGVQQILAEVPAYRIETVDLTRMPARQAEAGLQQVRREMSHQNFPTDRWPLFEIRASRLEGDLVRLHMSFDLLIGDVWSFQIFFRELFRLYRDPAAVLPPLELSFRDYVVAEQGFQSSERYRKSQEYWWSRLTSLPATPDLPLAMSPAELKKPRFTRRNGRLEAASWRTLKERASRAGLTPSGTLLAAFSETLAVWSKSPRFTLNLTFFNRLPFHPQINDIMGDFSATLLLAVEGKGETTFAARAQALQQQLWRDLEHVHVSGVRVLRELARVRRDPTAAAMPVVFTSALHNTPGDAEPAGEEEWRPVYGVSQTPQVWLDHRVTEQAGTLTFSWDVVEDLFPPGLMEAMFAAYTDLLERLADGGEAWEDPIPVRVPESDLELIAAANATAAPVPAGLLHEGFLRQAGLRPDDPAVLADGRTLSYGELARRSRLLGARLRELGAVPNQLVAVVMEKGWEQVVAVLGILDAGAAYLPIDAGLPRERIRRLLELGGAAIAVTQPRWLEELEWPQGVARVAVRPDEAEEAPALPPVQRPEDLAYVIFTSGSTGVPKGVVIDHRGALNTVEDVNHRFGVGPGDRVLALSSLSFDLSVYDIFGTLAAGGTVVMPEAWATREPGRWTELLGSAGVTVWNSVPALLEMLVEYLEGRGTPPAGLRLTLLSGDWIPVSLPERVRRLWPEARVISMGGATEASIWSILRPIESVEPGWKSIPYGRAMVNQTFHVLDERLEPRPVWVPGQLYIGGVGLALGYWRDEEKTAASFVAHPRTGERLYRTGDLGRWLPQGEIEFLGREDLQVKVQGHRIELGEIEAVLGRHPAVRAAVVKAVGEGRAGRRLAAYVVAEGPSAAGDLRDFLRGHLPEHMVPVTFRFLDALPLTANGKVDRAALPDPGETPAREAASRPAPAGAASLADEIATRVARVLGLDRVDPEAQLMELGMISVDMIRIANLIEKELGFRPRIDDFYHLPTCTALAHALEDRWSGAPPAAPPATAAPASVWESFERVLDPAERQAFKAAQHGLRHLAEGTPALPLPPPASDGLRRERRTRRSFRPEAVPLAAFGGLLGSLRQVDAGAEPRYLYPSAGGLYPVQAYAHVKAGRVEGLEGGTYYYDPAAHRLQALAPGAEIDRAAHAALINRPVFDQAAFSLFLVAEAGASGPLYGKAGRDFSLIEAGAMLQLLMTVASEVGLGLCPVGSLDFAPIRPLLRLSATHELLHSALGGLPADGGSAPPLWADVLPDEALAAPPASGSAAAVRLERAPRNGALPLSFAQRQLWFLHELDPESPHYNSPVAVRLSGRLDAGALERAMAEIVRRHESLRTTFHAERGEPVQVVAAPGPFALPLIDLSGLPAERREGLARKLIAEEIRRPFDLSRGPVSRFRLVRLGEAEHVAVITVHHIASDYWSLGILVREVTALYEAFSAGRPSRLAELPVQYADFAFWQRRWLSEETLAGQLTYWKQRLAGAKPAMELPADHPRPPVQSFRGAVRSRLIPRDLAERVKAVGRNEGATPFMTLLAAFAVLLHAFTGERDVLIGSPVASRSHADLEGLIGLFVSLLVFRATLEGDPEVREVISQVRRTTLEAQAHQDLPFGMLVEELRPQRNLSHTPIFQVAYTFQDARQTAFDLPGGLTLSPLGIETGTTQFDLILNVEDGPHGLTLALDHNTDLFESATILRLLACLEGILERAAERPRARLSELRETALEIDRREREAERAALESARRQSFQMIRRRAVTTTPEREGNR